MNPAETHIQTLFASILDYYPWFNIEDTTTKLVRQLALSLSKEQDGLFPAPVNTVHRLMSYAEAQRAARLLGKPVNVELASEEAWSEIIATWVLLLAMYGVNIPLMLGQMHAWAARLPLWQFDQDDVDELDAMNATDHLEIFHAMDLWWEARVTPILKERWPKIVGRNFPFVGDAK